MSDGASGFKSQRTQLAGQSKHSKNTTHLRMDLRSGLEPVGAGIARTVLNCRGLFSADGLKRYPPATAVGSAQSAVAFGRRVSTPTEHGNHLAGGHYE